VVGLVISICKALNSIPAHIPPKKKVFKKNPSRHYTLYTCSGMSHYLSEYVNLLCQLKIKCIFSIFVISCCTSLTLLYRENICIFCNHYFAIFLWDHCMTYTRYLYICVCVFYTYTQHMHCWRLTQGLCMLCKHSASELYIPSTTFVIFKNRV
jgi:hypothetical protein